MDSPEIREALKQALSDPDQEIRGEALVGLAERGDNSIISELLNEWKDDHVSIWSLEAAEITGDPRLFHRLNQFTTLLKIEDDSYFSNKLESAINACNPLKVKSSDTPPSR